MSEQLSRRVRFVGLVCLLGMGSAVWATPLTTGVDTDSPLLPANKGEYVSPETMWYPLDGAPAGVAGAVAMIGLEDLQLTPLAATTVRTPIAGGEQELYDAVFTAGVVGFGSIELTGPVTVHTLNGGSSTGTFATEIVAMDLQGDVPGVGWAMVRESLQLPSAGVTEVSDLGGGMWHIDSFFDVFTEVSFDYGGNWIPSATSVRMTLMPEPTTMVLLGLGGLALVRRRMT